MSSFCFSHFFSLQKAKISISEPHNFLIYNHISILNTLSHVSFRLHCAHNLGNIFNVFVPIGGAIFLVLAMTSFTMNFLGSGNARSKPPVNYNTNVLVTAPHGKWLIDCGIMGPLALKNAGVQTTDIQAAFITHMHGDHVFGIEEILFESYFRLHRKFGLLLPSPFIDPNNEKGEHFWNNYLRASMTSAVLQQDESYVQLQLEDYADVREICPEKAYDFFGVPVRIFPVLHIWNRSSFGICLDERVFYTSDTTFSRQAIESYLEQGAEIIFHDVSFLPKKNGGVHAAFDDLKTLPREWAEKIVFMHYDDFVTSEQKKVAEDLGFRLAGCGQVFQF